MGLPEVAQTLCTSSDISIRKTSIESKEESSPEMECTTSPMNFEFWNDKPLLNKFIEAAYQRQILPHFSSTDILPGSSFLFREELQRCTRLYLESIIEAGLVPLQCQAQTNRTPPTFTDNHFNLSLLADVAYAHSSNETQPIEYDSNKQQVIDLSKKNDCSGSSIVKCKRIRNNEACRKSRLRRKLLNEAAKEKLASLAHDNDILKKRIFTLEEEVKVAKAALYSRLRSHPRYGQNPDLVFNSLLYACEEITKALRREQEKTIIADVQPK